MAAISLVDVALEAPACSESEKTVHVVMMTIQTYIVTQTLGTQTQTNLQSQIFNVSCKKAGGPGCLKSHGDHWDRVGALQSNIIIL